MILKNIHKKIYYLLFKKWEHFTTLIIKTIRKQIYSLFFILEIESIF